MMTDALLDNLNAPRGLGSILAPAYASRYGCWPSRHDTTWMQEPWVLPYLRWLGMPWNVCRGDGSQGALNTADAAG